MNSSRSQNVAWFRTNGRCRFTGWPVTFPEMLQGDNSDKQYSLEIAKLGQQILLLKASGFVSASQMVSTLQYSDAYIAKHFDTAMGIVVIEDYQNVIGADFEARKKYFDYYQKRKFFRGAVLYNMLPLIRVSFNIARRLHFYNENAYAVGSYKDAVAVASDILSKSAGARTSKTDIGHPIKHDIAAPSSFERFRNKFGIITTLLNRMLAPGLNRLKGIFIKQYSESLLKFIESIDWKKEGLHPLEGLFHANQTFRKVPEAINFIKSEVDTLIRERLEAEKILLKSEERLRQVVEHAKAGIWEYDYGSDKIISTNNALAEITGYTKEEILSMRPVDFLTKNNRHKFFERLALLNSGQPVSPDFVYEAITKSGEIKWVYVNANIIFRDNSPYRANVVLTDITSLKLIESKLMEYQSKLKGLTIQLSMSEEKQRRILASELHDKIGQELFVIQLRLGSFMKSLTQPAQIQEISKINQHVVQIIRDARNLINDISPPVLYDFGFQEAVESLARSTESKFDLRVITDFSGDTDHLSDDIKVVLYRNIREIIHNTVKHAKAKNLYISSRQSKDFIRILVKDDGGGFDMADSAGKAYLHKGFGLFDLREKMEHLGGSLEITSAPGAGVSISMDVPLV